MTLPPGFRFKPTDEELVSYYLRKRVEGSPIEFRVIADVDLYRCEPWDLPHQSLIPSSNDLEWFFFSPRDRKYPHGTRTNRATESGYWKATGRDRTVKSKGKGIGMKKTLVFYTGRAPNGTRTDWLMHEYRLQESGPSDDQDAYVLCRVFKKTSLTLTSDGSGNPMEEKDEDKTSPADSPSPQRIKPEPPILSMNGPESAYMQYPPLTPQGQAIPGSLGNQLLGIEDSLGPIFDMKLEQPASDLESLLRLLEGNSSPPAIDFPIGFPGDPIESGRNEGKESKQNGGDITWNPWGHVGSNSVASRELPPLIPSDSPSPPSSAPVSSMDAREESFEPPAVPKISVRSRLPQGAPTHVDGSRPYVANQWVKFVRPPKNGQKAGFQDPSVSVESEPKVAKSHREIDQQESSEPSVEQRQDAEEKDLSRGSDTNTSPIVSNDTTEGAPATTLEAPPSTGGEGNDSKDDLPESNADDAEKEGGLASGVERQQDPVKTKTATAMTKQQEKRLLNLLVARVLGSLPFQGKSSSVEFPCGVGSICVKARPIACSCEKRQDSECRANPNPDIVVASSLLVAPEGYPEKKLVEGEEQQQQQDKQHLITRHRGGGASEGSTKHVVGIFFMGVVSAFLALFVFPSAWRATC